MDEPPDGLRELDRRLRGVRFEPRASLGPEIAGRAGRGEAPAVGPKAAPAPPGAPRALRAAHRRALVIAAAIAAGLCAIALGMTSTQGASPITIDRCCYDLDGGGSADDGVRVVAQRDAAVERLWIYEDLDGSGALSPADVVRLERGGVPALAAAGTRGLVTLEHCCVDFDGGGPDDDGVLVIGVPPDRVLMAAIYERGRVSNRGGPLRFPLR